MSTNKHPFDQFRAQVEPALISKLEEFELFGYDKVTEEELWEFLTKKRWKRANEERKLHEIVNDILSLNVSDYITYATIEAFKSSDNLFSEEGKESYKALFGK
ncbi:post-transcriptional regulator [Cytobacillus suaedae]|nr:post-transcriptional regulator [Cytobacillus suaedae]